MELTNREHFNTDHSFLKDSVREGSLFISQRRERNFSPKESDKTAGPLGTRVFTVRRKFCRYFLSPTKQITTKLVFVVSDHYGFVVCIYSLQNSGKADTSL